MTTEQEGERFAKGDDGRPATKQFSGARLLKADEERGEVEVVFATLGVVDAHGDRIAPGAIGKQAVAISAFGHGSWFGELPVGKGVTFERDNEAIFAGQFFMDTEKGRETFKTVRNMAELQEWSFSLMDVEYALSSKTDDPQVFDLTKIDVDEVSPVLRGAGVNTRTLAVKAADDSGGAGGYDGDVPGQPGQKQQFLDAIEATVEAVEGMAKRAARVRELRVAKGKGPLTGKAERRLKLLRDELIVGLAAIESVLIDPNIEAREIAAKIQEN